MKIYSALFTIIIFCAGYAVGIIIERNNHPEYLDLLNADSQYVCTTYQKPTGFCIEYKLRGR